MQKAISERDDGEVVAAIRAGDEATFAAVIDAYSAPLVRVAMAYVPSRAIAEEAVQETWVAVIRGIDRFEGRSSLKTWIFRILTNVAMKGGTRERRSLPFSALAATEDEGGPTVDPDRFLPPDHERWAGHWAAAPRPWPAPEDGLLAGEIRDVVAKAIDGLPGTQRAVISLRDVEGWSSEEVCEALELTPGNQRVILHRARGVVRNAIEAYYGAVAPVVTSPVPEGTEKA